ncbi:glycoside hydrolase family 104 protein [Neorhizobium galegae]|nr:glycoside hydrolase family 104 protein [Neorhizobium galegae]
MKLPSEAYALLNAISGPESAGAYDVIYGGQKVADLSDHPRIAVTIKSGPNAGEKSTAAGKYQFLKGTWDQYAKKLGLKDFSPESQDLAAWELAKDSYKAETGEDLLSALKSGDAKTIANVGKTLAPIWTSLPGGIEQGTTSSRFVNAYQGADGTPTAAAAVNALAAGQQPPRQPETNALVQNAQFVPPPFSGQRPVFAPLVSNEPLRPAELPRQAPAAPITPMASAADNEDELLKGWGLAEQSPQAAQAAQAAPAGAEAPSTDDALLKAWGLDKTDVAPAGQMAKTAAASAPAAPEKSSTLEDVIKSGASGVARGTMELIGLPGTIQNAFDNSLSRVTGDIASLWGGKGMAAPPPSPLSGAGLRGVASKASEGGTEYKPQTTPGKYAGTVGEFVPGAVLGPGNLLTNAVKFGVVPGVASEAAGQVTEGTALEPWARVGAAVAAPFATEGVLRAGEVLGNKLASMTPSGAAANNLTGALAQSGSRSMTWRGRWRVIRVFLRWMLIRTFSRWR